MKNLVIAKIFRNIADILEIKGDNVFRIRAYQRAADTIEGLAEDLEHYFAEDRLTDIPGIGKDLSEKIKEISQTGTCRFFEVLKKTIPEGLLEILKIPSVGPKTAKLLFEQLKIKNIQDLQDAIKNNKLLNVPGIKEKTIENIQKGIDFVKRGRERMPLAAALQLADEFAKALKKIKSVDRIEAAGSLRRRRETVRDIDILVVSDKPQDVMDAFAGLPQVKDVQAKGETKSSILTSDDIQIDCRVVDKKSFGAALLYFTGSKNFNIKLRLIAQKAGLKINEYGVFRGEKFLAGKTEEEIFKLYKMAYVEPELREDSGEVELAKKFKLPELIELSDIKGDLHAHSNWSDGANTIEEMAIAAQKKGYSYIAITDHSQSLKVANGLSITDLKKKKTEIDKVNKKMKDFRVLFGTEVDIDSDGKIDYPDTVLKEFDVVVAAIHTGFKQSKQQLTKRVVKACQNKYVDIISHPTSRLWGTRDGYEIDFEEIFKAASQTNTAFEINSFPQRLDLNDQNSRLAKERGVKLAINTDAHATDHLDNMQLGIYVARRGWLTRDDVINTLSLDKLLNFFKY